MTGRKTETVVVPAAWGGRDAGKMFRITEWPAARSEKWAWRLFFVVKGTTGEIPADVARLGMVGVAIRGINAVLAADVDFAKLEPLLDEMFTCVQMIRDQRAVNKATGELVATDIVSADDIEEVQTRGWLRSEVLRVHTNFSCADALWTLISAIKTPETSSTT